jgi:hypothetical protein
MRSVYFFSRHKSGTRSVQLESVSGAGLKPGVNLDDERSSNDIMTLWMAVDVFDGCQCPGLRIEKIPLSIWPTVLAGIRY